MLNGGNIGIGTTTPSAKLDVGPSSVLRVLGGATAASITYPTTGMGFEITAANDTNYLGVAGSGVSIFQSYNRDTSTWLDSRFAGNNIQFVANNANTLTVHSNGNVGNGTTTPWGKLAVTQTGTGGDPAFIVEDSASPDTSPFIITQAGDVGIASTSPNFKLVVAGTVAASLGTAGAGDSNAVCWNSADTEITENAGVTTCLISSERYKKNIELLKNDKSLADILKLRPVTFDFKADGRHSSGLIAEEVQKIIPTAVPLDKDGLAHSIEYSEVTARLVGAVQAQQKQI